MRAICSALAGVLALAGPSLLAQESATAAATVPHVVQFSGTLNDASAAPMAVKFALYSTQTGGEPLWTESQSVSADGKGRYAVLLGAATPGGLPQEAFSSAEAKWLGITVGDGEESPRTILVATPYALKASDADTLAGHRAADFMLARKTGSVQPETGVDITMVNAGTGITVTGNGTASVTVGLNTAYLATLSAGFAVLKAANTFTGNQTINGTLTVSGAINSTYLNSIAAELPTLAGNNTFSGTNKFTSPVTFALGQTFPGAGTISGVTAGTGITGGGTGGNVNVGLNTTYLNANYANLAGNNIYTNYNTYMQQSTVPVLLVVGQAEIETSNYSPGLSVQISTIDGTGVSSVAPEFGLMGITYGESGVQDAGVAGQADDYASIFGASVTGVDSGVWGDGGRNGGQGVLGTDDSGIAGEFLNKSTAAVALYAYNFGASGNVFYAGTGGGDCEIGYTGNLACSGSVNIVGRDGEGRARTSTAVTATENWMEDFGDGELRDGSAVVQLGADFASMVEPGAAFHVFLTPKGDSNSLFVSGQTATSFEVHEAHGGRANIAFDYRIVAKPRGKQDSRLPDVTAEIEQLHAQTPKLSETPLPRSQALHAERRVLPKNKEQK